MAHINKLKQIDLGYTMKMGVCGLVVIALKSQIERSVVRVMSISKSLKAPQSAGLINRKHWRHEKLLTEMLSYNLTRNQTSIEPSTALSYV